MENWARPLLLKLKKIIDKQVPVGELTDENYIVYFRQLFILVSSVLGFILCTVSLYTQKDTGILNIYGLVVTDIILVINLFLIQKQKDRVASYVLGFGLLLSLVLGIFDDYHFLSKGFIWFLIIPFVMFVIMEIKDFIKILLSYIIVFVGLQVYFYPKAFDILPMQGGILARKYWLFLNIEYATAFVAVIIMLVTYWYVNNFLKLRFKRFREQIAQTSKLTALGEMAGNIGHEINNPLTIIKVSNTSLKRSFEKSEIPKERVLQSIELIDNTVERISKIINSLRLISRQQDCEAEILDPCRLIEDVIPISNMSILRDQIKFDKKLICGQKIKGSSVQFSQIILNLLNNAIYAVKELDAPSIEIKCFIKNSKCVIEIIDNGAGVPEKIIDKIFEPFYTSKPVGEGTGLGLSLCRSMAQTMNGNILYKRVNNETIFQLDFPRIL